MKEVHRILEIDSILEAKLTKGANTDLNQPHFQELWKLMDQEREMNEEELEGIRKLENPIVPVGFTGLVSKIQAPVSLGVEPASSMTITRTAVSLALIRSRAELTQSTGPATARVFTALMRPPVHPRHLLHSRWSLELRGPGAVADRDTH